MSELVAESLNSTLDGLSNYETCFKEGDTGEIRIYLNRTLTPSELQWIQDKILEQGVVLTEPVSQVARIVYVRFVKRIAPLLIIGGVVAAVFAGITGWQVFKFTEAGIPLWVLLLGGGALAYILFRKPAERTARIYLTRGIRR